MKVPVVCETTSSFKPVAPLALARNADAPLARPLIFKPVGFDSGKAEHFKIVYVWISYRCKSQSVVFPVYGASETPHEYTLASPISNPLTAVLLPLLWLYNLTTLENAPPILIKGDPVTLLTLIKLPISNGTKDVSTFSISLGLSISNTVVPVTSTSKPFIYALPGESLTHIKSSKGVFPSSVNLSSVNNPSESISSFKEFWILTRKGSTE